MTLWRGWNSCRNGLMRVRLLISGFLGSSSLSLSWRECFKTTQESTRFRLIHWRLTTLWFQRIVSKTTLQRHRLTDVTFLVCSVTVQDGMTTWNAWTNRSLKYCTRQYHTCYCCQPTTVRTHHWKSHTHVQFTRHQWEEVYFQRQDIQQTTCSVWLCRLKRVPTVIIGSREEWPCWLNSMTDWLSIQILTIHDLNLVIRFYVLFYLKALRFYFLL